MAQHAMRIQERRGLFARLREWWAVKTEPVVDDWPAPVAEPTAEAAPKPAPTPRPTHPPFAQQPARMAHVLDRMQHMLVDLRSDPSMTAVRAATALYGLSQELSRYAQQEMDQARRMERNAAAAQAQAVLLAEAEARGAGVEAAAQAVAATVGRAVHVAAVERTGVVPRITDGMVDPRVVPPDVSAGDDAVSVSPVHADDEVAPPVPSEPFLTAAGLSAGSELADRAMGLRVPSAPQQDAEVAS